MEANTAPRQAKADLNSCGTQRRGVAEVRAACCMPSTLQAHPQQHSAVMVTPWIHLCLGLAARKPAEGAPGADRSRRLTHLGAAPNNGLLSLQPCPRLPRVQTAPAWSAAAGGAYAAGKQARRNACWGERQEYDTFVHAGCELACQASLPSNTSHLNVNDTVGAGWPLVGQSLRNRLHCRQGDLHGRAPLLQRRLLLLQQYKQPAVEGFLFKTPARFDSVCTPSGRAHSSCAESQPHATEPTRVLPHDNTVREKGGRQRLGCRQRPPLPEAQIQGCMHLTFVQAIFISMSR